MVLALLKLLRDSIPQDALYYRKPASGKNDMVESNGIPAEDVSEVSKVRRLEMRMAGLINLERKMNQAESHFAKPLQWDEDVAQVARSHSLAMLQGNFCGHTNSEGEDHAARLLKAGMNCTMSAENVANGFETIEATMAAFMDEPPFTRHTHRFNILNPELSHVGVGIVEDQDGRLVVTQNFVRR